MMRLSILAILALLMLLIRVLLMRRRLDVLRKFHLEIFGGRVKPGYRMFLSILRGRLLMKSIVTLKPIVYNQKALGPDLVMLPRFGTAWDSCSWDVRVTCYPTPIKVYQIGGVIQPCILLMVTDRYLLIRLPRTGLHVSLLALPDPGGA
ncbi:hypothetical protein Tco_1211754 [Tanacetum coccineum]